MSTHKGSRSRINNYEAAREAWERIWGKKQTTEKRKGPFTISEIVNQAEPVFNEIQSVLRKLENDNSA